METSGPGRLSPVMTAEQGIAIWLTNKTGLPSVKGTVLDVSGVLDLAVAIEAVSGIDPIAIMYSDGIADGLPVLVVISGIAEVLVDDATLITRGDWAGTSDATAGRAQARNSPPAAAIHDQEIGHYLESKAGGVNVLVKTQIHFR